MSGSPVLSSDGRMYALTITNFATSGDSPPSLIFGSLDDSAPTTFATAGSPQESIQVAGWTKQ